MKGFNVLNGLRFIFIGLSLMPLASMCSTYESSCSPYGLQGLDSKWTHATSVSHLSGYADAGFIAQENDKSSFFMGHFNPIFHYLYKDLILAEGELELEIERSGETEVKLEYGNLALFLNDYMILRAGKILSPLGFFYQNLHPSWINKLPTNPPGFHGEQAAPEAEIGMEVRGGFYLCPVNVNYAIYIANGPKALVEDDEIEEIEHEGFNADIDGSKVVGGRIGIIPTPALEFGVSAATGKLGLFDEETDELIECGRRYCALGADAALHINNFGLRGEIIQQEVHSRSRREISGGRWRGWYGQATYLFSPTKFEAIVRYGQYCTPHSDQDLKQWALGIDYWFAPSVVAKVAYMFNCGQADTVNNDDSFIFQLSYGF